MRHLTDFGNHIRQFRKDNKLTMRDFLIKANLKEENMVWWSYSELGYIPPLSNDIIINVFSAFEINKEQLDEILIKAEHDRKNFKIISEEEYILKNLPFACDPNSADKVINMLKENYKEIKEKASLLSKE